MKKESKNEPDQDPQKAILQAVNDVKRLFVLLLLKAQEQG